MTKQIKNLSKYKKTKYNQIPDKWVARCLSDYGETFSGLSGKSKEDFGYGKPFIPYLNIFNNIQIDITNFEMVNIKKDERQNSVKVGDIFFTTSSETPTEVGICSVLTNKVNSVYLNSFCFGFRLKNFLEIYPLYIGYFFNSDIGRRLLYPLAQGATRFNLSKIGLIKLPIPLPPLPEQKKIAEILSTWDEAIEKTQKLIQAKERRKKGLMQQLLTGKKRLLGFKGNGQLKKTKIGIYPNDWQIKSVDKVFIRMQDRILPEANELYQEIGIRSHGKGLFYKAKVEGKSLGNKRVFKIIPNCFIVNIVFAWEMAIGKTTENEVGMIASHRFPMYKPKENVLDLDFVLRFFSTKRGKLLLNLASPGGAGRNKTLGQNEFSKTVIPVPYYEEQQSIACVLTTADEEISLLKKKLDALKEQKKGLMQKLLTGEVRVRI